MKQFLCWCLLTVLIWNYIPTSASENTQADLQLLLAQSVLNTTSVAGVNTTNQCRESAVYVSWSAGTSAGSVQIESADSPTYAGTWAPLSLVSWSAVSKQDLVQITGVHKALRTRIASTIVGGTVNTWFVCN